MMFGQAVKTGPKWLLIWAVVLLALGLYFRITNIDRKLFSNDETTTSLHVSGHSYSDYQTRFVDGRIHSAAEFLIFQHIDPTRRTSDVLKVLASEDPEHAPLYYVAEHEWMLVVGNSIAARRGLSVVAGIAAIAAAFWFSLELFGALQPAMAMAALVAVSPFHVFYAQTAREYELWALLILISSALLARALRRGFLVDWLSYAIAGSVALYTDVIFLLVLVGQLGFVVCSSWRKRIRDIVACGVASGFAIVTFVPWLIVMINDAKHHSVTKNAYTTALPIKLVFLKWAFIVGQTFMDIDYKYPSTAFLLPVIYAIIIVAFVMLIRDTKMRVWLHVVALTTGTTILLLGWDVLKHTTVTTQSRYLVPMWIGIECAVGFAIAKFAEGSRIERAVSLGVACVVAFLGVASLCVSSQYREWYGGANAGVPHQVDVIAASGHPVIFFKDDQPAWDDSPLLLSNYVAPNVRFAMIRKDSTTVPAIADNLLTVDSTPQFRAQLEQRGYIMHQLYAFGESGALRSFRAQANAVRKQQGYIEYQTSVWRVTRRRQ